MSERNMELSLNTPALLFPAISLLLLAYTNRFLGIASLIRQLHKQFKEEPSELILSQISNLRLRIKLIRDMQFLGILCIFSCVISMFLIYISYTTAAEIIFGISLLLLIGSLSFSIWEIRVSIKALTIQLSDIEDEISEFRKRKKG